MDNSLGPFLTTVGLTQRSFQRARAVYSKQVAPEFDWVSIFDPDEIKLSKVLGWMLDPQGSHCQGPLFLELFLEHCGLDWSAAEVESAVIHLEYPFSEGRFDILITNEASKRRVVIENKPFASDGYRQLERYLAFIGEEGVVLYLPGTSERLPSGLSISRELREKHKASNHLVEESWTGLIPLFIECGKVAQAPRVRDFIAELPRYIAARFSGIKDMTEVQYIVEEMSRSAEAIESSFLVAKSLDFLREHLIDQLGKQLESIVPPDWVVLQDPLSAKKFSSLYIEFPGTNVRFFMRFEQAKFGVLSYGLNDEGAKRLNKLEITRLAAEAGPGEVEVGFPWWLLANEETKLRLAGDWGLNPKPWMMIQNGSAARNIATEAARLFEALRKVIPV